MTNFGKENCNALWRSYVGQLFGATYRVVLPSTPNLQYLGRQKFIKHPASILQVANSIQSNNALQPKRWHV